MKKNKHKQHKNVATTEHTGTISITNRGVGYVRVEEYTEDIEILSESLNTALHRDTVKIVLLPKRRGGRIRGEVIEIIERFKTRFVGVLEEEANVVFFKPDDIKCYVNFIVKTEDDIPIDQKVAVEIIRWTTPKKNPLARIVEVLGPLGAHETEMHSIVSEQGFNWDFPEAVQEEVEEIKRTHEAFFEHEVATRKDFRGIPTCTIDPGDAKDFDDAISIQKLKNGNIELGVHIADVSAYVKPGGAMDKEAQHRGTSVYLVDRTIPMLPELLSNNLCSLVPEEDRLAFSAVFEMDPDGNVFNHWFGETVIHSKKRFSYEAAQKVLDEKRGDFYEPLALAQTVATALRKKRFENGAIGFETDEIKFVLDEKGRPVRAYRKERLETMKIIEDLMLLANREVAQWIAHKNKKGVFVWRIHDAPKTDRIEELALFLKALGYSLPHQNGTVQAQDINTLFAEIEGAPEQGLIETATIRSMSKAVYATKNIGHFGLAFDYYTHFTSPIRRYPDVMVHRIVKSHINGKPTSGSDAYNFHERMCAQSTEREIAATHAERDSIKLKQVEYLAGHIGEIFDGVITGIHEWGIFVEEQETMAEGLVHTSTLRDDHYELDEHGYRLVGSKTGKTLSLGDKVSVKLKGVNIEQKEIDWTLLSGD